MAHVVHDPRGCLTTRIGRATANGAATRFGSGANWHTKLDYADTGVTKYQYDDAGNLAVQTDARGQRGVYAYDAANRLTQIQYGPAASGAGLASVEETLSFGYDEAAGGAGATGRLTHADVSGAYGANHLAYRYDAFGRVTQKTQQLASHPALVTSSHYNAKGQKDQTILPSGAVIGYRYGADGRVLTITVNGITIVREIEYFPFGDVASWIEANGTGTPYARSYDTDGRITQFSDGDTTRQLRFDAASRVTALADTGGSADADWSFGYDDQDRLTSAVNAATAGATAGIEQGFTYDVTGNRASETAADVTTTYTTDPASNRLTQVGGVSRSYDAAGNTTSDGTHGYAYSARNRLVSTTLPGNLPLASYTYNAWGERIAKDGTAGLTQYVYDAAGHLLGEYAASGALIEATLWLDDTPVAILKPRPGATTGGPTGIGTATAWQGLPAGGVDIYWIEPDHLDTPRAIVNAAHQPVWQWNSDPFGTTQPNETPTASITTPFVYNLRFPGQIFDTETATHYNYFRDYEPATGRYLQSDPIGLGGGSNTFVYVESGPLVYDDALGLWSRRPDRWGGRRHHNGRRNYTPGGGIYGLFCLGESVAKYIGKTNNFRRRYHEHNSRGGKLDQCECGNAIFVPLRVINDPVERDAREKALIKKHKPKLNKLLKGGGCSSCGSGSKRRK